MSTKVKSVVRRLGQGYLGHVVADSRPAQTATRFDPAAEGTAVSIGPREADTVESAAPEVAAQPPRHPEPRTESIHPRPLVGGKSAMAGSGPPETVEPVVRKISSSYTGTRLANTEPASSGSETGGQEIGGQEIGGQEIDSRKQSKSPKSRPAASRNEPGTAERAGIGNASGMRERTTNYKITKKGSGLKVTTVPTSPTGPENGASTDRAAPTGGDKSPESPVDQPSAKQIGRPQAGSRSVTSRDEKGKRAGYHAQPQIVMNS